MDDVDAVVDVFLRFPSELSSAAILLASCLHQGSVSSPTSLSQKSLLPPARFLPVMAAAPAPAPAPAPPLLRCCICLNGAPEAGAANALHRRCRRRRRRGLCFFFLGVLRGSVSFSSASSNPATLNPVKKSSSRPPPPPPPPIPSSRPSPSGTATCVRSNSRSGPRRST